MKKNRRITNPTNAVDPATTTAKDWGFIPVAGKGGKTTNFEIPAELFKRELAEYLNGGIENA
jgi:hypothetical protein